MSSAIYWLVGAAASTAFSASYSLMQLPPLAVLKAMLFCLSSFVSPFILGHILTLAEMLNNKIKTIQEPENK